MAAAAHRDHYDLLGVKRQATNDEIRKAYKSCAMRLHPDRNPEGGDLFKQVTNAYQTLTSPKSKRKYDADLQTKDFKMPYRHRHAGHAGPTNPQPWPPRPNYTSAPNAAPPPRAKPDGNFFARFPQPRFFQYGDDAKGKDKGAGVPPQPPQPPPPSAAEPAPRGESMRRRREEDDKRRAEQQKEFAQKDVNFGQWYKERCKEGDDEIRARVRREMEKRRRADEEEIQERERKDAAKRDEQKKRERQEDLRAEYRAAESSRREAEEERRRRDDEKRWRDAEMARKRQVKEVEEAMNELQKRRRELEKEREQSNKDVPNVSDAERLRMKELRERRGREAESAARAAEHKIEMLKQQQQQDKVERELAKRRQEEEEDKAEAQHRQRLDAISERDRMRQREMREQAGQRKEAAAQAARDSVAFREQMKECKKKHDQEIAQMREESDRIESEMRAKLEAVRAAKREGRPIPKLVLSPIRPGPEPIPASELHSPIADPESPIRRQFMNLDDAVIFSPP